MSDCEGVSELPLERPDRTGGRLDAAAAIKRVAVGPMLEEGNIPVARFNTLTLLLGVESLPLPEPEDFATAVDFG